MIKARERWMIFFTTVIFIVASMPNATAQANFWESPAAYLGQSPPGDTPKIFAKGLLADSQIVLGRVAFSKDGKEFYFGFARHWFDFNGTGVKEIIFNDGMTTLLKKLKPKKQ